MNDVKEKVDQKVAKYEDYQKMKEYNEKMQRVEYEDISRNII
jgi:hypothetical protein